MKRKKYNRYLAPAIACASMAVSPIGYAADVTGDNLAVTGNSTVGGNSSVGGNATVSGNAAVGGTLGVTGATTTAGITNTGNITNSGNIGTGTLGVTGATTTAGITNSGNIGTGTLGTTGNATVGGALGVSGDSTVTGNSTVRGKLTVAPAPIDPITTGNGTTTLGDKQEFANKEGDDRVRYVITPTGSGQLTQQRIDGGGLVAESNGNLTLNRQSDQTDVVAYTVETRFQVVKAGQEITIDGVTYTQGQQIPGTQEYVATIRDTDGNLVKVLSDIPEVGLVSLIDGQYKLTKGKFKVLRNNVERKK